MNTFRHLHGGCCSNSGREQTRIRLILLPIISIAVSVAFTACGGRSTLVAVTNDFENSKTPEPAVMETEDPSAHEVEDGWVFEDLVTVEVEVEQVSEPETVVECETPTTYEISGVRAVDYDDQDKEIHEFTPCDDIALTWIESHREADHKLSIHIYDEDGNRVSSHEPEAVGSGRHRRVVSVGNLLPGDYQADFVAGSEVVKEIDWLVSRSTKSTVYTRVFCARYKDWQLLSIALSPDGKTLAAGYDNGTVILWNIDTGAPMTEPLTGHTDWVRSLAFNPDGSTLASGSDDKKIILWDVDNSESITELKGHDDWILHVAFNQDGRRLISGDDSGTIIIWNVEKSELTDQQRGNRAASVWNMILDPYGHVLLASGNEEYVTIHSLGSDRSHELEGHLDDVSSIAFSLDCDKIASGDASGTVILWKVETGKRIGDLVTGRSDSIGSISFSPSGQMLAAGDLSGYVIVWDISQL
jgi:WD40 repeat protein